MKLGFNIVATAVIVFVLVLTLGVFISGWERPPMETEQIGYRGVGMQQVTNPRLNAIKEAQLTLPFDTPPAPEGGAPAGEVYENVQILGDLTEDQFNRIMVAVTEWVSPDEGCGYCHNIENLAEDVPTKLIARRMFQMNRHINESWTDHVAQTGVTCYTCHRGQPVPAEVWFQQTTRGPVKGLVGYDGGQNHPSRSAALSSMLVDPFSEQLDQEQDLRGVGDTALPTGQGLSIKQAEYTYSLMLHMSEALGVNCTFCHNSRSFISWEQSRVTRLPAWHGIRMVRELNQDYVLPLKPLFAPERLGPLGDAPKINCATCHRGRNRPLGGAQMAENYPELSAVVLEPVAGMEPRAPSQTDAAQPERQDQDAGAQEAQPQPQNGASGQSPSAE